MRAVIKPYQQGSLDGMCGVYSIINVVRLSVSTRHRFCTGDCVDLFGALTSHLEESGRLAKAVSTGFGVNGLCSLLRTTDEWLYGGWGWRLRYHRPWYREPTPPPFSCMADEFSKHLERENTGIIACIYGYLDHWSVVSGVSKSTIQLFDSIGSHRISIDRCSSKELAASGRSYQFIPRQQFFITIDM